MLLKPYKCLICTIDYDNNNQVKYKYLLSSGIEYKEKGKLIWYIIL